MKRVKALFNSIPFHQNWLFVITVFFVVFGILPAGRTFYRKHKMSEEMRATISSIESKTRDIKKFKDSITGLETQISYLEDELVSDLNVQEYMIDIVVLCSKAGYKVERFSPSQSKASENYVISLSLVGNRDPTELVREIEKMKRITKVNNMEVAFEIGRNRVTMRLDVLSRKDL